MRFRVVRRLAAAILPALLLSACEKGPAPPPPAVTPLTGITLAYSRFARAVPPDILAEFSVAQDGTITAGPVRFPGQAIDYSPLMSNASIAENFHKIAFRGGEFGDDSHDREFKESIKKLEGEITLKVQRFGGGWYRFMPYFYEAIRFIREQGGPQITLSESDEFRLLLVTVENAAWLDGLVPEMRRLGNEARDSDPDMALFYAYMRDDLNFMRAGVQETEAADECHGTAWADDPAEYQPAIFIHLAIPDRVLHGCAYEELIQVLGLFRDDDTMPFTMFADEKVHYDMPTWQDGLFIRILYDPRLKPGMKADEAMPIVRTILTELRPWAD